FFQAEDGIRDYKVTGVQTCALPISDGEQHQSLREGTWSANRTPAAFPSGPKCARREGFISACGRRGESASRSFWRPGLPASRPKIGRASCRECTLLLAKGPSR